MIPKIIHYIWFGGNPLPEDAVKCINSWKKYCPDYEIKEWNESNFDINASGYMKEACAAKKWAFASDYARLSVLVEYGGIYMDTDVEVVKPLDEFLSLHAFSGFETEKSVPTGLMACEKGHAFFKKLLHDYDGMHFIDKNGNYDLTTNVTRITKACLDGGLILNNQKQEIDGFTLYPNDFFCPLNHDDGKLYTTDNTHTIHWFAGSWKSTEEQEAHKKAVELRKKFPGFVGRILSNEYEWSFKIKDTVKKEGIKGLNARIKRFISKKSTIR